MKLYKGSKFAFLRNTNARERKWLKYVSELRQGDLIHCCTGFNVRIKEIKPEVTDFRNTWFVTDFEITDTDGGLHSAMYCCDPPRSTTEIERYFKEQWTEEALKRQEDLSWDKTDIRSLRQLLSEGKRICDDDGVRTVMIMRKENLEE